MSLGRPWAVGNWASSAASVPRREAFGGVHILQQAWLFGRTQGAQWESYFRHLSEPRRVAWARLLCGAILVLSLIAQQAQAKPWYEGELRGIYGPQNLPMLASEGFNLVYRNRWHNSGDYLADFKNISLEAKENGVTLIAGLYYLGAAVDFNYSHVVTWFGGTEAHAASPLDPTYWKNVIEEPAVALAGLSLSYPIAGLAFDFELYLAEQFRNGPEGDFRSYSYDALSLKSFASEKGLTIPDLPPNQTYRWLENARLLDRFQEWQRGKVARMAKDTAEAVYRLNPDFSLGILGFGDCWFHWTILKAWNSQRVPMTIWDEASYNRHDPETTTERLAAIKERGLNARYLPGLYTTRQSPSQIVRNMSEALSYCNAFWVYQYDHGHYDLGTELEYHRAYRRFMTLKGIWGFMIGLLVAILLLAGIALGAVALRKRMKLGEGGAARARGTTPPCPGEPNLESCRTCRYMQTFGETHLCSRLGVEVKSAGTPKDDSKARGG